MSKGENKIKKVPKESLRKEKIPKKKKVTSKKAPTKKKIDKENEKEKQEPQKRTFDYSKYGYKNSARKWLWTGVIIISIFMFSAWIMSAKLQIENYDKLQGDDSKIVEKTQEYWNEIFEKTQEEEATKLIIEEKIKNILKEIENAEIENTSTTSTITETTSSTTSTILTENLTEQTTTTEN